MTTGLIALGYQENWWSILSSGFMRNALLGGTLVALAAGLIGYFIVVRNTAFAAHALAHIGFPGATGAVLLGIPVTLVDSAPDLASLQSALLAAYGGLDTDRLTRLMAAAFALAELKGLADVAEGQ